MQYSERTRYISKDISLDFESAAADDIFSTCISTVHVALTIVLNGSPSAYFLLSTLTRLRRKKAPNEGFLLRPWRFSKSLLARRRPCVSSLVPSDWLAVCLFKVLGFGLNEILCCVLAHEHFTAFQSSIFLLWHCRPHNTWSSYPPPPPFPNQHFDSHQARLFVFSNAPPTWDLAAIITQLRRVNSPLWSIQQQLVFAVVRAQRPSGFPPAGAIQLTTHRRSDCTAYSRGGSGRSRENIWASALCSQRRVVT